jgi:phage/plasmid-associated DNA primase
MKELTGGTDKIVARGLYSNPVEFIPQFKPIVCTNNLYDIADKSDGVWRRIDKVDHISYFTDEKPDPSKNKFAKDKGINKKFASWKAVLMSLLVEIACVKQGIVTPCDIVSESSKSYRNEQDITAEFINARIVQEDGVKISRKGELYQEFKLYITDMRGGKPPSANELYTAMDSKFGLYSQNKGWKNCRISFDDDNDDVIVQSL